MMRDWFDALQAREKLFVGTGAVVLVLAALWALVWMPIDNRHDELRASVDTWHDALEDLRPLRHAAASGNVAAAAVASTGQSPLVVVDQTLETRGLNGSVRRRQPTPNGIRVEFENVAFDDLVLWLGDLAQGHGLEVQAGSFSVAARNAPGRIDASVTLERLL